MALRQQGRGSGLKGHHAHSGVLCLQIPAHAADSAAGADPGHKDVHLPLRVRPDLRAGGLLVCRWIGGVFKLSCDDAAGNGLMQFFRLGHSTRHARRSRRQDNLRAVGGDQSPALYAHGVRHGENHTVALCRSCGSQTDTGVAGGRFDDGAAGSQTALRLRPGDHVGSHPVLGAARGIHALQLGQQHGLQVVVPLVIAQLQQGRAADQLSDAVINRHWKSLRSE